LVLKKNCFTYLAQASVGAKQAPRLRGGWQAVSADDSSVRRSQWLWQPIP